jgi:hypothetical protein
MDSTLPRLAVIADVAVERVSSGALLLHRLLRHYPPERLANVYNAEFALAEVDKQLPGVTYVPYEYRIPRFIRNRFNPFWPVVLSQYMRVHTARIIDRLSNFRPSAILTVPHWYLWFTAAAVARRLQIPLHLIVHDDWPSYTTFRQSGPIWNSVRWGCRKAMKPVYRQAVSRLCVSPGMEERCRAWYGKPGTILYPSLGEDSPESKVRVRPSNGEPPVVAFCGSMHQDGTIDLLRKMAGVLGQLGGHLDLYTPVQASQLAAHNLVPPTVRLRGFFPASEMGERVGSTAHALFLPASFEAREREDVATLFPSKLADYSTIGLPILVWGPAYSSAARWAAENPGSTLCITEPDPSAVKSAVASVAANPAFAAKVAEAAIRAGENYFLPAAARSTLLTALRSAVVPDGKSSDDPASRCDDSRMTKNGCMDAKTRNAQRGSFTCHEV